MPSIAKNYGLFKCKEASDAMMDELVKNNHHGKLITIQYPGIGKLNNIWSIKRNMVVSTNGFHCGVEYNGVTYCNIHPQGLLTLEWLIDFEGFGEPKVNYIPF